MDKSCLRHQDLDVLTDVVGRVVEVLPGLSDGQIVTVAVGCLQVVGRSHNDEAAIDHDRNLVTKLLCFIHSVGGKQDRCIFHALDHFVEGPARHRVNSASWLIQEKDARAEHD